MARVFALGTALSSERFNRRQFFAPILTNIFRSMTLAFRKENCSLLKKVLVSGVYIAQVLTKSVQSTWSVCIPKGGVCSVLCVHS